MHNKLVPKKSQKALGNPLVRVFGSSFASSGAACPRFPRSIKNHIITAAAMQVIPSNRKSHGYPYQAMANPPTAGAMAQPRLNDKRMREIERVLFSGALCCANADILAGRKISAIMVVANTVRQRP